MRSETITLERLDRQRSLIGVFESRIEDRAGNGENVELSLSALRAEKRLYRRMLSDAPLDVLDAHSLSARFT